MAEMIVIKCDIGSKAAMVFCPVCARISRQTLKQAMDSSGNREFLTTHTCPVCGTVFHTCNSANADVWKAVYSRYIQDPGSYNANVKEHYSAKKLAAQQSQPQQSDPKPVPVQEAKTANVSSVSESTSVQSEQAQAAEGNVPSYLLLDRKIERWKRELLDTGKRNKMINYRETKRATLRILEPGATELFNLLAVSEETLTFQRPISKDSDFRTYSMLALLETLSYSLPVYKGKIKAEGTVMEREKTLKNLRSKTKLAQEEQGTNILYLSFGFILWREHNRESSPWLKSPLLMMPVQLGLKSLNAPYTLSKYDEEIEVNPTLDYLFNQNYGIDLPTFELKNKDSFEDYLEQIEEIIDKKGWRLVREVSLGLLSFLKISMYHDLDNNRELMMNNRVLQAISGDRHALGELPAEAHNFNFDKTEPSQWHEVVDSDSSQEEAILLSKLGVSFVMQGPPGTGKSQTITNIIAEALGDGKKVLFVSEKSAALQVVLKRLTEARLDDFCLSLHNYKANKKEIIDNIGANLGLSRSYVDSAVMSELTELFHDRQYLDEYAGDLHKKIEPFGESVYMVFGKLAKLSDASAVEFRLENPTKISKKQYRSLLYVVNAFEKALHNIDGTLSDNPWADTAATSSDQTFKTEMIAASEGLSVSLNELETLIASLNGEYGTSVDTTWSGSRRGLEGMEAVFELPLFPLEWRDAGRRSMLRERALKEEKIDQAEQGHARKLAELVKRIDAEWNVMSLGLSAKEIDKAFRDSSLWTGDGKAEYLVDCSRTAIQSLEAILGVIEEISNHYEKARTLLKLERKDHPSAIIMVSKILQILLDIPEMDSAWFDIRKTQEYLVRIDEAKEHQEIVRQKTDKLLEAWEPSILELDADGMLARFKTEYTGMFHKLKGNYKDDIKKIKLLSRTVGLQVGESEAIALLQQIGDLNGEKKWFIDNEKELKAVFPNHYKGIDTDWDKVSLGIQKASDVANQFPYANIPVETIQAIREIGGSIQLAAEVRKLADLLEEEAVNGCLDALQSTGLISGRDAELSLSETLLPNTRERMERETVYQELIGQMDAAKKDSHTSYADMRALIEAAAVIRQECIWFKENIPDIAFELNMDAAMDDESIRQEIAQAELILKNHDVIAEKDETEELIALFGNRYTGNFTDWQGVIRDIDAVDEFESKGVCEELSGFIQEVSDNAERREDAKQKIQRIRELSAWTEPKLEFFEGLFPKNGIKDMPLHEVASKYDTCLNGFGELNKWLDYVETKAECDKEGLSSFTNEIASQNNSVRDVRRAFERGFYMQWLSLAINDVPSVQTFRRRSHEQKLDKFVKLDKGQFELSKERIRDRIIRTFPSRDAVTSAHSELRILQHEMEKKRRIMPLRKLFHEIPTLLLTLKPCLMMSPLSVAYFLNAGDYHFDMVIFDEASQILPQDAIGAIFRAEQVIIAGDTRQLPPTNFFSASISNGNDDYDDENDDDFGEEVYDSILEETANVLPNRTLLWHYRSKHEHLIAFSNQEIYRNELVTFPSSNEREPDTGVEFVFVEDGYYEDGGKNRNILEAKRCVELVKDHIDKHPERSLGIIAFSEKQQQAILLEIQRFREKNPKYEEFFAEDREDEFFVKNLENVQGDERDTIFFSVGYAKTQEQRAAGKPMSMRFGPLGMSGGERRLNVAITRAKSNVKLVSSILPSDIDLTRTESEGIRMLRSYIEFAMNGGAALASANWSQAPDDFVDAIYQYICDKGYQARQYVGCSGYRIDIAVEHPNAKAGFVAGIECDGVSYASARTARDRDRLRGSVLKNMGWDLYRVWSTEWYRNPELEGGKLTAFIDKAIARTDERLKKVQEQKASEDRQRQAEAETEKAAKQREERKQQLEEQKLAEAEKIKAEQAAEKRRKAAEEKKAAEARRQEEARLKAQREAEERHRQEELERKQEQRASQSTHQMTLGEVMKQGSSGEGLYDELVNAGFTCIDNRASSSIIWVLYQAEQKETFEQTAMKYHAQYKLEKRGAMATGGKAAWRIMT